jgi:hypothetical protein
MVGAVPAIHAFGAANKDVDGRDEPGHDENKAPAAVTTFYRTAVALCRP